MSRTRASVQAGICARWGSGTCAFSANHCDDPTSFMSSRQLQIVAGAHGGNCVLRRYTEDIVIGSCGDSFCTSVSAACEEGTTFQAKNNLCDIVQGDNLDRTLLEVAVIVARGHPPTVGRMSHGQLLFMRNALANRCRLGLASTRAFITALLRVKVATLLRRGYLSRNFWASLTPQTAGFVEIVLPLHRILAGVYLSTPLHPPHHLLSLFYQRPQAIPTKFVIT